MNIFNGIGRICNDLELQGTNNKFCKFNIAIPRQYKKEITDFISCTAFNKTAEFICNFFKKGNKIAVSGSVKNNQYTDKDGNKRTNINIIINEAFFCESNKHNEDKESNNDNENEFDLPF